MFAVLALALATDAPTCQPFKQEFCTASDEAESDGLSAIGAVSASWCDVSNPFVALRPFADVRAGGPLADLGDVEEPICVSDGADPALDSCASIFAIETAELAAADRAGGVDARGALRQRRAVAAMRLQLLGLGRGRVIGVDVTSQRRARAAARAGRRRAGWFHARRASTLSRQRATQPAPCRARRPCCSPAALRSYNSTCSRATGRWRRASAAAACTVDVAAAGYRLRQVELMPTAAGERTTVAAALLQSATDPAHHEIVLYQLSIGDSDMTMPTCRSTRSP